MDRRYVVVVAGLVFCLPPGIVMLPFCVFMVLFVVFGLAIAPGPQEQCSTVRTAAGSFANIPGALHLGNADRAPGRSRHV